ncbi:MAG: DUF2807 domain-containing protein, partial [Bacteroidales bacterium]|nr:DUF2807 domain-containing protein [Bacteroidales bacterium]
MKKLLFLKRLLIISLLINVSITAFSLSSLRGDQVVKEDRKVSHFNSISLRCSVDIFITQGENERVIVEADEGYIKNISTTVKDQTLIIDTDNTFRNVRVANVYITVADLEGIKVSGSGDVVIENPLRVDDFLLLINGSGDVLLNINASGLKVKINGSGDVKIKGDAADLFVSLNGSGDIVAEMGEMDQCSVKMTGSGDLRISGEVDVLNVKQVSSGDVSALKLIAEQCLIDKSGSGDTKVFV